MKLHIAYDHPIAINAFEWTPATYQQPPHVHASLEIGLCLTGKGRFFFGNKQYTANPGDLFLVNNEERHIAQSDPDDPSRYLFINFGPALLLAEEPGLLLPFSYRSNHFCNHIIGDSPRQTAHSLGTGYSGRTAREVPGVFGHGQKRAHSAVRPSSSTLQRFAIR